MCHKMRCILPVTYTIVRLQKQFRKCNFVNDHIAKEITRRDKERKNTICDMPSEEI